MKTEKMKVFHGPVNYGTQAGMLAAGLRSRGIEAISAVESDSFNRKTDIIIGKGYSTFYPIRKIQLFFFFLRMFSHYNIFHFYFGKSLLPNNRDLSLYKLFGKKVVMEYLGTDVDLWLGYNGVDWRGRPVDRVALTKRVKRQAKQVDRQITCCTPLYEFVDNSIVLPLALDLEEYTYTPRNNKTGVLTIMHCPTNRMAKKSDYIEAAIDKLKNEGYVFNYKCVTNVTHAQLKEEYRDSDVVIDQLNRWYGTVGVEAMALGRPLICTIHPHLCLYDKRFEDMPIINADIKTIYQVLKNVLDGKYDLERIGRESREFVEKVHSLDVVTDQLIDIYKSL